MNKGSKSDTKRSAGITHKIMAAIPSRDTRPEMKLRKALFAKGYRYRVNYKSLPGKPDIVYTKAHIVVFVDGDFWHGHNWAIRGYGSLEGELSHYTKFWRDKILRNIERDRNVNESLQKDGWIVLRFWESDIKNDVEFCVNTVGVWYRIMTDGGNQET